MLRSMLRVARSSSLSTQRSSAALARWRSTLLPFAQQQHHKQQHQRQRGQALVDDEDAEALASSSSAAFEQRRSILQVYHSRYEALLDKYDGDVVVNQPNKAEFTGFRLVFLGTGATKPTHYRNVSGLAVAMPGKVWLFDCGDGTQRQVVKSEYVRESRINTIFVSHMHGDHVHGLPAMLTSIFGCVKEQHRPRITIVGPIGISKFVKTALALTYTPVGGIDLQFVELVPPDLFVAHGEDLRSIQKHDVRIVLPEVMDARSYPPGADADGDARSAPPVIKRKKNGKLASSGELSFVYPVVDDGAHVVRAVHVKHKTIPAFGYMLEERPHLTISPEKAAALGVPVGPQLGELQRGNAVTLDDGTVIQPIDVAANVDPGRRVAIIGDTEDASAMHPVAYGADLVVHEATVTQQLENKALANGHSSSNMAGAFAKSIGARNLVLNHFSNRYCSDAHDTPEETAMETILREASDAFGSNSVLTSHDHMVLDLPGVPRGPRVSRRQSQQQQQKQGKKKKIKKVTKNRR